MRQTFNVGSFKSRKMFWDLIVPSFCISDLDYCVGRLVLGVEEQVQRILQMRNNQKLNSKGLCVVIEPTAACIKKQEEFIFDFELDKRFLLK